MKKHSVERSNQPALVADSGNGSREAPFSFNVGYGARDMVQVLIRQIQTIASNQTEIFFNLYQGYDITLAVNVQTLAVRPVEPNAYNQQRAADFARLFRSATTSRR